MLKKLPKHDDVIKLKTSKLKMTENDLKKVKKSLNLKNSNLIEFCLDTFGKLLLHGVKLRSLIVRPSISIPEQLKSDKPQRSSDVPTIKRNGAK